MTIDIDIENQLKSKAKKSLCRFNIAAVGLNRSGKVVGRSFNRPSDVTKHGNKEHAEAVLIRRYRNKIKTIIICRVNNRGSYLPIDPCPACLSLAQKYDINIISLCPGNRYQ